MFNSFLDGTKSAIEMAAVANATGLAPAPGGLEFPPCGVDDLPRVLRPRADGGELHHSGQVEVVSSLERDGQPIFRDLRWGVYVTFRGDGPYVQRCFREYGLLTDDSGRYAAMYKPFHLIGLELGISVASVGLRREPTGVARGWHGDVVATAKRDLREGELLDGEGGYTVYGKLMPAADSMRSRRAAARARAWRQAQTRDRGRGDGHVGGRCGRRKRCRRALSSGDGARDSRRADAALASFPRGASQRFRCQGNDTGSPPRGDDDPGGSSLTGVIPANAGLQRLSLARQRHWVPASRGSTIHARID